MNNVLLAIIAVAVFTVVVYAYKCSTKPNSRMASICSF